MPRLEALTPEQRRGLPALQIGGSVWSSDPASRLLIVNGALVREGETLAPGLVLESIQPRLATLRWNGQAFSMGW